MAHADFVLNMKVMISIGMENLAQMFTFPLQNFTSLTQRSFQITLANAL